MVVSYWEPKNSTRSLGSAVFKFYRAKFATSPSTALDDTFVLWTGSREGGDGHLNGTIIEEPWESLTRYFNTTDSTGKLAA
jgi:hypothetical protein